MTATKKSKKLLMLASAVLLLAGCDVKAKPSYGDDDYLLSGDTSYDSKTKVEDLTNNLRTLVYDKLVDNGSINSDVLDAVLYNLAQQEIGNYDELLAKANTGDENAKKVVADIKERMDDKLYAEVSSGSYDTRNKFDEKVFVKKIQQSLTFKIADQSGTGACSTYTKDYVFLKDSRDHLYFGGAYADGTAYTADDKEPNVGKYVFSCNYTKYTESKYLEEIYRELLVEKYVKDEEADALGRSAGRKINYVSIAENSKHPEAAANLIHVFVEKYIKDGTTADLSMLEKAWKGVDLPDFEENPDDPINMLLREAEIKTADYDYTLFGDIMADYNKINDDLRLTDKSIENDFTNSGAYKKEVGLEIKTNNLRKQNLSDDGWFAKSNDSSSLPSAISNRLFDVAVANNVNNNLNAEHEDTANKYVKKVNGVYYLKPETLESPDVSIKNLDCVIYDNGTYHIVQIEEAVNSAKLRTSENTHDDQYTDIMRTEVVEEMARKYAARDTYKEKAMIHYLENADIKFHDSDVYEFFKNAYPDIWDNKD